MKENLPQSDHKTLAICKYYEWFRPAVDKWLDLAKLKAVQRVRRAAELDRICTGDTTFSYIVKHSTSANDVAVCFYQVILSILFLRLSLIYTSTTNYECNNNKYDCAIGIERV